MAKEKYKVGDRFGKWTLLKKLPVKTRGNSKWLCICDCGTQKELDAGNVYTGKSKMCGPCGAREREKKWRAEGKYGRG